ncbi:tyrosine--tRNA ligase [Acidithiobacillus caldus]|uniref:Tyrosine--tRNA ligase n=2 Tax=Acidithiobacillus caldus TaxID=33059 RepID=F9ZTT4_ACICS|nr:tyrosine--tRNA ligase [Acidithiobacillus caldus]AEK59429.1 Tyrosyl-tRNA synthetase [Acidithiobacillus caldus SM-1]AUW33796.1 tyrosine--tRNA ligase [Acidithiobacillus caldus]MCE5420585.1 tyrosine--tRNA ligase [Acidithiobacillus sp.]QER45856.1 Tyrosyl-tRNA synthetase (Tyrosine--tRNA ligase) (TyrRS) (TyrRZ) [Acidithiobacillus caldus]
MEMDGESAGAQLAFGSSDILPEGALNEALQRAAQEGRALRVKLGMDPTAPDLHLGHTVLLHKARQFQDLGHQVLFLIGDFTARIGDPTGKSSTRLPLSAEAVQANAETYRQQIFRILDPARTEVVFNSHWLDRLRPQELIQLAARYTVARMLERDDFSKRYHAQQPIAVHEFLYPLLQGYDSVALRADVELGGTDQRFNLLVGRELQKEYGQRPQVVLTMPILEGLDGVQKMSKSLGNTIALEDTPEEMFGKLMSISDTLMWRYYALLSAKSQPEQVALRQKAEAGEINPRDCKLDLAQELVTRFHGSSAGVRARETFLAQFQRRERPDDLALQTLRLPPPLTLAKTLQALGWVRSSSEGMRKIREGAVHLGETRIEDPSLALEPGPEYFLQFGKRHVARVCLLAQESDHG